MNVHAMITTHWHTFGIATASRNHPRNFRSILVLLLGLMTAVLAGCDSGDPDDSSDISSIGLVETENSEIPFIVEHDNGSALIALSSGGLNGINGAVYVTEEGHLLSIETDGQGLPTTLYLDDLIVVFDNYRDDAVDMALIGPDGAVQTVRDVPFDDDLVADYADLTSTGKTKSDNAKEALGALGLGVNIAVCTTGGIIAAGAIIFTEGAAATIVISELAATGLVLTCSSAALTIVQKIRSSSDRIRILSNFSGLIGTVVDGIQCGPTPSGGVSCLQAVLGAISTYIALRDVEANQNSGSVQLARAALDSGDGEVKMTLTWTTSGADLDLWVTDPCGESIGWSHTSSASGGELDRDDRTGSSEIGENIFWKPNTAPPGDYKIEVEHYDGTSPASYFLLAKRHGHPNVIISGTVTSDERQTVISSFEVAGNGSCPSGKFDAPAPQIKTKQPAG